MLTDDQAYGLWLGIDRFFDQLSSRVMDEMVECLYEKDGDIIQSIIRSLEKPSSRDILHLALMESDDPAVDYDSY